MGIFGWLKPEEEPEDTSLIEISNDSGDQIVAKVPTNQVNAVEASLDEAGIALDRDENLARYYNISRIVDNRNPEEYRYHSAPIVNPSEDLEPEVDDDRVLEGDEVDLEDSGDSEASEQSPSWRPW